MSRRMNESWDALIKMGALWVPPAHPLVVCFVFFSPGVFLSTSYSNGDLTNYFKKIIKCFKIQLLFSVIHFNET